MCRPDLSLSLIPVSRCALFFPLFPVTFCFFIQATGLLIIRYLDFFKPLGLLYIYNMFLCGAAKGSWNLTFPADIDSAEILSVTGVWFLSMATLQLRLRETLPIGKRVFMDKISGQESLMFLLHAEINRQLIITLRNRE